MLAVFSPKGGHGPRRSMRGPAESGDECVKACVIIWSPFVNIIIYTTLCFMKTVLRKLMPYTLISHTDVHTVRGRPTLNDVERFRNGPFHEFYGLLKAGKLAK